MAVRICYICNKPIADNEKSLRNHNGFCHEECFNKYIMSISNSKRKEQSTTKATTRRRKKKEEDAPATATVLKKDKTEEEYREQKEFADYLVSISGLPKPKVEFLALAKNYSQTYGFSYPDMTMALKYWHEILGNPYIEGKNPVGMIPYIMSEAKEFYAKLQATKEKNKEFDLNSYTTTEVHIEKPKGKTPSVIDIEQIGN